MASFIHYELSIQYSVGDTMSDKFDLNYGVSQGSTRIFTMLLVSFDVTCFCDCFLKRNVTRSRGTSHMMAIFYFDFSMYIDCPLKMLHFDPNPTSIGHLVAEI